MSNDGYYPLPAHYKEAECRSCGAKITWVQTATGARMPLDLAHIHEGHALTHFATCPQRKAWSGLSERGKQAYAEAYEASETGRKK